MRCHRGRVVGQRLARLLERAPLVPVRAYQDAHQGVRATRPAAAGTVDVRDRLVGQRPGAEPGLRTQRVTGAGLDKDAVYDDGVERLERAPGAALDGLHRGHLDRVRTVLQVPATREAVAHHQGAAVPGMKPMLNLAPSGGRLPTRPRAYPSMTWLTEPQPVTPFRRARQSSTVSSSKPDATAWLTE